MDAAPQEVAAVPTPTAVDRLREQLAKQLIDLSRNNPLLYYRDFKLSRLSLPAIGTPAIDELLGGETLSRADLEPPSPAPPTPVIAIESNSTSTPIVHARTAADVLTARLTAIRRKARENEEERGLRTLFAGLGMISWPAQDGGRDPLAIAFLIPCEIIPNPRVRGDLALRRFEGADVTLNPALLEALPPAVAERLKPLTIDGALDDFPAALRSLRAALAEFPELTFSERCALGNFSFQLMSMVEDLREAGPLLEAHSLVRAIAGDVEAQSALQTSREGVVAVDTLDSIPPSGELFVLDADPWQSQAIHTLLEPGESHAIVDGPPGTGKSQTIANFIAAVVASGKTVLFVAEKRAALDVVRKRLTEAGLGKLVLDLHGNDVTRKAAYAQLRNSSASLRSAAPAHFESEDATFDDRRRRLNDHCAFMNTPLPGIGQTPYQVMGRLEALKTAPTVTARWTGADLAKLTPKAFEQIRDTLIEASSQPQYLMRDASFMWSTATFTTDEEAAAAVASVRSLRDDGVAQLQPLVVGTLETVTETIDDVLAAGPDLLKLAELATVFRAAAFALDTAVLDAAIEAEATPFSFVIRLFDSRLKSARGAVVALLATPVVPQRTQLLQSLQTMRSVESSRRVAASRHPIPDAPLVRRAIDTTVKSREALSAALGAPLPTNLAQLRSRLDALAADTRGPYIAAKTRKLEASLTAFGLGAFLSELRASACAPSTWADAFERAWLASYLDRVMGRIATFDGRVHDGTVTEFCARDRSRLDVAGRRVLRKAAERYLAQTREFPKEQVDIDLQLSKQRKLKPIRELFEQSSHVLTAIAPCVMASPLSVSQFLPRLSLFDFVVFDEGSQVAPENAVTAIVRGKRLVVAGDENQLPPTAFFTAVTDPDDEAGEEEDANALVGMQSLLDAIKPFAKPLGLRVHYRSLDETLIAFSNYHIYGNRLVTFPGTGRYGQAVSYEHVDPSQNEVDEASSAAEVRAVVARVIDHAEHRPHESLGVITMSIKHAQRVQTELDRVRKDRPDLDAFFSETRSDAFFVKNLERVQGDERDAIILSIGYGRTKTGAVSHNFGPVNVSGGERRLNVAITRAKIRILLISQIRFADLDPKRLNSRGAKLLAQYLCYVESGGRDLGRDQSHEEIPLNDFEADIKLALERAHGWSIEPQYGVGEFRIDLAVQHPDHPGTFVLAIECDGASYHSSPTARLRDRLRQQILEARGWHFLRIWSTDWFNNRDVEIARALDFYNRALANFEIVPVRTVEVEEEAPVAESASAPSSAGFKVRSQPSPISATPRSIDDVPSAKLVELIRWIESDERLRTDEELVREATQLLGFGKVGSKIRFRLERAIAGAHS